MKLSKSEHKSITAAGNGGIGTTWYRVTPLQFSEFIENRESNLFIMYAANTEYFDALNLSQMFGSAVYDEDLYICESDGQPIVVGSDPDVDPETAFEIYTAEDLEAYIQDATEKILLKYITYREFDIDVLSDIQTNAAIEALQGGISLEDVIKAYNELW